MNKRTVKITLEFDVSEIPDEEITPKEIVWEAVKKDMINLYWDVEGWLGSEVEIIDE